MTTPAVEPTVAATRRPESPPSARRRLVGVAFWAAVLGLLALDGWRLWDDRPPVPLRTVQDWTAKGRVEDAERELKRQTRKSPSDGAAWMALARSEAARKDYAACAETLRHVPFWHANRAEALFLEGQAWKLIDRARNAELAWEALVADDPLHPVNPRYFSGAARELIAHYVVKGRLDEARRVLWQAYEATDPVERPDVLLMRLRAELERVAHEEAVEVLRRYAAADPTDWEARRALAVEEQHAGRPEEADRQIAACLKARPNDPWVWRSHLEILHLRGDRETPRDVLARAPISTEGDPEVWKHRGLDRFRAGEFGAASEAFEKAVELNPTEGEYAYLLGMADQRLGRRAQAAEHLKRSRRLREAFEKLHEAFASYQEVASRSSAGDPAFRTVVERIASLCDEVGWSREAVAWRRTLTGG
jgi:Flp pilus assembly protein TadD